MYQHHRGPFPTRRLGLFLLALLAGLTLLGRSLAPARADDEDPPTATYNLTLTKATSPAGGQGFPFTLDPGAITFLGKWGSGGISQGQFNFPSHIAVDEAGNVYVADQYNHRVQKFDNNGAFIAAWGRDVVSGNLDTDFEICGPADTCKAGESGSGAGHFSAPDGIAARGGFVYVVEPGTRRVQKFTDAGVYLSCLLYTSPSPRD